MQIDVRASGENVQIQFKDICITLTKSQAYSFGKMPIPINSYRSNTGRSSDGFSKYQLEDKFDRSERAAYWITFGCVSFRILEKDLRSMRQRMNIHSLNIETTLEPDGCLNVVVGD